MARDPGSVGIWIQRRSDAVRAVIAAEKRGSVAPAAGSGNDLWLICRKSYEVGLVRDKLSVEAKRMSECAFALGFRVVGLLQATHRGGDEGVKGGDVVRRRHSDLERGGHGCAGMAVTASSSDGKA